MKNEITIEEFTAIFLDSQGRRKFFEDNFGKNTQMVSLKKLMRGLHKIKAEQEESWLLVYDFELTKSLVAAGANIRANNDGPLRLAAAYGWLEFVEYFVELGADVHANNECALYWAIRDGHLEVAKFLLEKGANLTVVEKTAFYWAKRYNCLAVLDFIENNYPGIYKKRA